MKHKEFCQRTSFTKDELIANAYGRLVEDPPGPDFGCLPAPPFLMLDRVLEIRHEGSRGRIVAEQDVRIDAWYFQCHFIGDPVQPGCLGIDALWQMLGLYCAVRGAKGTGRALGCKELEFSGEIRPRNQLVRYEVDVKRYTELKGGDVVLAVGLGKIFVDGVAVCSAEQIKVGMFSGLKYADYPLSSKKSVGGVMEPR